MRIVRGIVLPGMFAVTMLMMGCGGNAGPKMHPISGSVTLDDKPLENGQIIFVSSEPGGTPDAGPIKNGKFAFNARAGKKRVEIQSMREMPDKMVPDIDPAKGMRPLVDNFIPEQYNKKSELTAEVGPKGKNQFDFKLTEKKTP